MSPAEPVNKQLEAPCWCRPVGSRNVPQRLTNSCQSRSWVMQKQLFHWGKAFKRGSPSVQKCHPVAIKQPQLQRHAISQRSSCVARLMTIKYSYPTLNTHLLRRNTGAQQHLLKFTFKNLSRGRKRESRGTKFVSRKSGFCTDKIQNYETGAGVWTENCVWPKGAVSSSICLGFYIHIKLPLY